MKRTHWDEGRDENLKKLLANNEYAKECRAIASYVFNRTQQAIEYNEAALKELENRGIQ